MVIPVGEQKCEQPRKVCLNQTVGRGSLPGMSKQTSLQLRGEAAPT